MAAIIASKDKHAAAIASSMAARRYNLKVIRERIEDNAFNYTRFWVIAKNSGKRTGDDKTSILFSLKNRPGVLGHILKFFAREGINLTRIESRPIKKRAWEYIFYLDFQGHGDDLKVKRTLKKIEKESMFFKLLGSYPKGVL
jgi:chorismate mutase/prephenate dehydratase